MNDKIKRLSSNLSEIIPDHDTIQDLYFELRNLMVKQKDYFSNISPENMVKVLFYIWSIKKTGNFNLGDKLLNNILFAILITTEGNHHREECPSCDGAGEQYCNYCDGNGNVECDNCDGDGVITCSECDGDGRQMGDGEWENCEECDGAKELTCPDCAGEGKVDCNRCYNGYENCSECDGHGEIKTDEFEYSNYFIVTWNNFIKDRCELTEGTPESAFSEYEFDKLRDEYVVLYQVEEHAELKDFIEINEVYCVSQSDNPIIDYSEDMHVDSHDYSMKPYLSNPI
jgi:hypothetical protein